MAQTNKELIERLKLLFEELTEVADHYEVPPSAFRTTFGDLVMRIANDGLDEEAFYQSDAEISFRIVRNDAPPAEEKPPIKLVAKPVTEVVLAPDARDLVAAATGTDVGIWRIDGNNEKGFHLESAPPIIGKGVTTQNGYRLSVDGRTYNPGDTARLSTKMAVKVFKS